MKINSDALEHALHSGENSLTTLSISQSFLSLTSSEMSVKRIILSCNITFQLQKHLPHINTVRKILIVTLILEMRNLEN